MALGIVVAFSFIGSLILLKITDLISPLSVAPEEEMLGLDVSQHDEQMVIGQIATSDAQEVHRKPVMA